MFPPLKLSNKRMKSLFPPLKFLNKRGEKYYKIILKRKHHFGPYILGSWLIYSLHFCSNQFSPCYFQFVVNLVIVVNSLMKNAYVANSMHYWHTLSLCVN